MKRKYSKPTSIEMQLETEGFMCMSFGGEGEGKPAQSNRQDFESGFWDSSNEEDDLDENF